MASKISANLTFDDFIENASLWKESANCYRQIHVAFHKKHCKFWIILLGKGCDRYFDMLFQKITYQKSVIFGLTIVIYDTFESHKVHFHAILLIK